MSEDGAWSRRVSPRVALNSPEASQGAAALARASRVVRRAGDAGASLPVAMSTAKTARSGVAKSAGEWKRSLVFITLDAT